MPLGPPVDDVIMANEDVIKANEDKVKFNKEKISKGIGRIKQLFTKSKTETPENREVIVSEIKELQSKKEQLERQNEDMEGRMSLKDRVKMIFKKYGFTAFSVLTAVGVVIGVIVSYLKKGLTSVAKGLGGGLKTIGKKIGDILPGIVGAIANFIFKTAGEVIGFLGEHAWLLMVAVVLYMVEQFKKKKR